MGEAPYNPFIIVNKERGKEVHLPFFKPTTLADYSLLGTGQDNSNISQNRYYLSENNIPWAINIPYKFSYPLEKEEITGAHLKFGEWAESNGTVFQDWYMDNSGYRNNSKIY